MNKLWLSISVFACHTFLGLAESEDPKILLTDGYNVGILNTGYGNVTWIGNGSSIEYVDFHYQSGYTFWSDSSAGTISRLKYPSDSETTAETILTSTQPRGIAVDYVNDHLYWADTTIGSISRSNLDGSNTAVILNSSNPLGIEIDLLNGWIYFTTLDTIKRCRLDGTQKETIVVNVYISGNLALDFHYDKMYWVDTNAAVLMSSNFDGSNKTWYDVYDIWFWFYYPFRGIAVTNDNIYFTLPELGRLYRMPKNDTSLKSLIWISSAYLTGIKIYESSELECLAYNTIVNAEKRSKDFTTEMSSDQPLSDNTLQTEWYRVISNNGDEIATSPPGLSHCGTKHPVWFSGDLPTRGQSTSGNACIQTDLDDCEMTISVNITNCGQYYLYYLNATYDGSAYCFGSGLVKCPMGLSSETGFYPGCSSNYPNDTIITNVKAELMEGQVFTQIPFNPKTPSLVPIFRCAFDEATTGDFVYDVYWCINDIEVIKYLGVFYWNINRTVLKTRDWTDTFKLNMEVKCAVRLRFSIGGTPGKFMNSSKFAAGIFPDQHEYRVVEGEILTIQLTSTVPVECMASHPVVLSQCYRDFYLFVPQSTDNDLKCTNNIANKNIVFKAEFCGVRIKTEDWNVSKSIEVVGYSDGMYNFRDRISYINISTLTTVGMFRNINADLIKVTVIDKDSVLMNRQCQSVNDPHITTFDGKYYHFMDIGEHVLYRNDKGPYWVHVLLTNCGFGWPGSACHCAVAIRSGNSLFVVRTCLKISRNNQYMLSEPVANLTSCDEDSLQVKAIHGGYKVKLPIGTEITIQISRWSRFIGTVSIKPTVYDIDEARGLCGVPNQIKNPSDDYTHRENGPVSDDQVFAKSWSVTKSEEKLFVDNPEFFGTSYSVIPDSPDFSPSYCSCETTASHKGSLDDHNQVSCNLTAPTQFCSPDTSIDNVITAYDTSCSSKLISKRSVNAENNEHRRTRRSTDEFREYQSFAEEDNTDVDDGSAPLTFRNGWTADNARTYCIEKIRESLPPSLYSDFVDLEENNFIESCVKDIELTGGSQFVEDTVSAMVVLITTELVRNESLYQINDTENGQTLLESLTSQLCSKNCSGNGQCIKGVCVCSNEYVGDDCSYAISTPPSNISLPFNGLCKKGIYTCTVVSVYGNYLSEIVWYQQRYFQIRGSSMTYVTDWVKYSAEFKTMFAVSVQLKSPTTQTKSLSNQAPMAEGYEIRMSYDGENFGESTSLIIFDEGCYSCNTSKECVKLSECPEVEQASQDSDEKSTLGIAVGVSVGILCLICVFVGLYMWKNKEKNKKQRVDSYGSHGKDIYLKSPSRANSWISQSELQFDIQHFEYPDCKDTHIHKQVPPKGHFSSN